MKKYIAIVCFLFCPGLAIANDFTVGMYKSSMKGPPPMDSLMETYISGVGMGVFYSNIFNMTNGQKAIFCIGKDVQFNGKDAIRVFNSFLTKYSIRDQNDAYAVMVLALQDKYPCR